MYTKHKTRGTQYSESPCNLLLGTREPSRSVGAVVPKYQEKTPLCLFQTSILLLNFPVLHLSTAETKLPSVYVTSVNCLVQSLGNKLPSPLFFKNTSNNHQQQRANTIISLCVWAFFFAAVVSRRSCRFSDHYDPTYGICAEATKSIALQLLSTHCRGGGSG